MCQPFPELIVHLKAMETIHTVIRIPYPSSFMRYNEFSVTILL